MVKSIKVVHIGVGALGSRIVKHIMEKRKGINYVGAIDIRPEVVGRDLGEIVDSKKIGIEVTDTPEEAFDNDPHIAIHTTVSSFEQVYPQIRTAVESGTNVISTCEQLSYPYFSNKKLAKNLDRIAKEHDVTVLGTGINPGFLMDVRPFVLSTACTKVNQIEVTRRMNASPRRKPFQKKIGVGRKQKAFKKAIEEGEITGHVGLEESISLIAHSIGWHLDEIQVTSVKPVLAEEKVASKFFTVKPGEVKGSSQEAYGIVNGTKKIILHFTAFLGTDPSYDEVLIEGTPKVNARISPCWHGDYGTVAMIVNLLPTVINERSGLLTMNNIVKMSFKEGKMARFVSDS